MDNIYTKIYQKIKQKIPKWDVENFYLSVIRQNKLVSIKRLAQGEIGCSVNPFELAQHIRALNGDSYVIAHNHPSGRLDHSFGDMRGIDYFREVISFPLLESMVFTRKTFRLYGK